MIHTNKIRLTGYCQVSFLLVFLLCSGGMAAIGDLDPSFGGDGIVTTAIGSGDDNGYDIAVQVDGKIVLAGTSNEQG